MSSLQILCPGVPDNEGKREGSLWNLFQVLYDQSPGRLNHIKNDLETSSDLID